MIDCKDLAFFLECAKEQRSWTIVYLLSVTKLPSKVLNTKYRNYSIKVKKLPNKTLLLVGIFFLFIILTTAPLVTVKASPDCIVSVVFDQNGLSTITLNQNTDFNVSVKITNVPSTGIDFYSIKIHWDPAVVTLKHNDTASDVLSGGFTPGFAGPSFAGTHFATGTLDDVAGYNGVSFNSGNGTLFKMLMHSKAPSASNITIVAPNWDTYLMHLDIQYNIDETVNGTMDIVIPEFSVSMLLTVFIVTTTLAIAAAIVSSRKRRVLPRI
jgi:hypothetical protein